MMAYMYLGVFILINGMISIKTLILQLFYKKGFIPNFLYFKNDSLKGFIPNFL